jgi:hypothetical protein
MRSGIQKVVNKIRPPLFALEELGDIVTSNPQPIAWVFYIPLGDHMPKQQLLTWYVRVLSMKKGQPQRT